MTDPTDPNVILIRKLLLASARAYNRSLAIGEEVAALRAHSATLEMYLEFTEEEVLTLFYASEAQ